MIRSATVFLLATSAVYAQDGLLDVYDGETLWQGGIQVSGGWFFRQESLPLEGDSRRNDPEDRTFREHRATLAASYGVLPQLSICGVVPWIHRERAREDASGTRRETAEGLGDLAIMAKYRVWKRDAHLFSFNWTLFAGAEIPTGDTGEREGGKRLSPQLQPGSGSWDVIAATAVTLDVDRLKINAVIRGVRNGTGAQDYKEGDALTGELTVGYRVIVEKYPGPLLRLQACLKWTHRFRARQDGDRLRDSGGDALFLRPAAVFWPRPWLGFVLEGEIPLYQDVGGRQLGLDFAVSISVSVRF
ncbi:MAG: transporter [Planctomycetota bacterium]